MMAEQSTPFDLLGGIYDETVQLLLATRRYMIVEEPLEHEGREPLERLFLSQESLRITTMLTQVLAWLMLQRAVNAGEVPREAARAPENRLGARELCSQPDSLDDGQLPNRMLSLLRSAHGLYTRVSRLDDRL